jgi:hypothetical protein
MVSAIDKDVAECSFLLKHMLEAVADFNEAIPIPAVSDHPSGPRA